MNEEEEEEDEFFSFLRFFFEFPTCPKEICFTCFLVKKKILLPL